MLGSLFKRRRRFKAMTNRIERLESMVQRLTILTADSIEASRGPAESIRSAGFQVFSQFDDDGIIAELTRNFRPDERTFIEFGVEDYSESNTRYLLKRHRWSGLVLDGDHAHIHHIRSRPDFWLHDLTAIQQFITVENIDQTIQTAGFRGTLGLLSVDIDGNDYWVWKAIQCVEPKVVVCEYNAIFGPAAAVTVPYRPDFVRQSAHHSNLYFGASLSALCHLADSKNLRFIGCNTAGNNAYFVQPGVAEHLPTLSPTQGFVDSNFREGRDDNGQLTFRRASEQLSVISHLPVVDLSTNQTVSIEDLNLSKTSP